jgi:hypothetical protein
MRVLLKTIMAGPAGGFAIGDTPDLPEAQARALIAAGYADEPEAADEPRTADAPAPETATPLAPETATAPAPERAIPPAIKRGLSSTKRRGGARR